MSFLLTRAYLRYFKDLVCVMSHQSLRGCYWVAFHIPEPWYSRLCRGHADLIRMLWAQPLTPVTHCWPRKYFKTHTLVQKYFTACCLYYRESLCNVTVAAVVWPGSSPNIWSDYNRPTGVPSSPHTQTVVRETTYWLDTNLYMHNFSILESL